MGVGFLAAGTGDWLLAILASPVGSAGFLGGVCAFALAHVFWMVGQFREARPSVSDVVAGLVPLVVLSVGRLYSSVPVPQGLALIAYSAISAVSFATACATCRVFYSWGIGLLLFSDLMIAFRLLHVPGCGFLVGPTYVAAEILLLVSWFRRTEPRWEARTLPTRTVLLCGTIAGLCFLLAMAFFPGGGYNPCFRMLSALGRSVIRDVEFPWCHYLFTFGLALSSAALFRFWSALARTEMVRGRSCAIRWGGTFNVAGLMTIGLMPENVSWFFHNVGCWLAFGGGVVVLVACDRPGRARVWTIVLGIIGAIFGLAVGLHALGVLPFAPYTPTLQKGVILSFALWTVDLTKPWNTRLTRRVVYVCAGGLVLGVLVGLVCACRPSLVWPSCADRIPRSTRLSSDEQAALRFLDHVTGDLSVAEEKDWWQIGGTQHGLFAKRYNIAFIGYAAAALGLRGDAEQRRTVGRILRNCISRYLKRDIWAYSMSKSYWGRKPWAPDPCYRENVMYTGHLLQLLAFYEYFTGDLTYWTKGFDFVWDAQHVIRYDVKKLIDRTVSQMRRGPTGGVTCEPGLLFFPCNNHVHFALRLFARLGHGDWSREARRWEEWALDHFVDPLFGGGGLNLVYHVRSGIAYPRGQPGLDGWSLLWYEPWASNRGTAVALWKQCASCLETARFAVPSDRVRGRADCCHPADTPPTTEASFLAAAARACDDVATAERLEQAMDARYLKRRDGFYYLDLDREWRLGATANRIIALALSNGTSFRALLAQGGQVAQK